MAYDDAKVKGSTSQVIEVMLRSSTTGQGATGIAYGSVTASYCREGGTRQAITLSTGSPGDAYSSGKWAEVDATNQRGLYQLHIPNAALATGANAVTLTLQATGVIDKTVRLLLIDANLRDGAGLGLSRLDVATGTRAPESATTAIQAKTDLIPSGGPAAATAWTSARAAKVDNLDAAITSRSTYAGADTAGTTTLLGRILGTLAVGTHSPQSGDSYARLGAPAGSSHAADVAAVKSDTAAVLADTGTDGVVVASGSKAGYSLAADQSGVTIGTVNALAGNTPQSGDAYARLGAPAGASHAADVAAVKTQTAAIEADTQDLQTQVGAGGAGLTAIGDARLGRLDVTVSSRLAATSYTAPDNSGIASAKTAAESASTAATAAATRSQTLLDRLGAWTGSGVNTILGAFTALFSKAASKPSDITGTYSPATDSNEALSEAINSMEVAISPDDVGGIADAVRAEMDASSTKLAQLAAGVTLTSGAIGGVADGVWNEALTGHGASGSAGAYLAAAATIPIAAASSLSLDGQIPSTPFSMYSGDTKSLSLAFTDASGSPQDINGWTVTLTAKSVLDALDTLVKTVTTHTNAGGGITRISFDPADTSSRSGDYDYDIQATTVSGATYTVTRGTMTVQEDVT